MISETLLKLNRGEISLMSATRELGLQDAGFTLHVLREAGLTLFQLDNQIIDDQSALGLEPLRAALKTRRALRHHDR
jgi:hypothetical protein